MGKWDEWVVLVLVLLFGEFPVSGPDGEHADGDLEDDLDVRPLVLACRALRGRGAPEYLFFMF